jgi:hypothetical protein
MSAKATRGNKEHTNGIDIDTDQPITHADGRAGHCVAAECVCCVTTTRRRLLERDYRDEEYFKQPMDGSDYWVPVEIYRHCDECGRGTTHFVV